MFLIPQKMCSSYVMKDFLFLVPIQRKQICNIDQYLKKSKKKKTKKNGIKNSGQGFLVLFFLTR